MLKCRDGAFYTGITTDVARRFAQHQAGKGARYTRANPPLAIALVLECADKGAALRAEYAIKQLDRTAKLALIARCETEKPHCPSDKH
ncbi:GIY-YIG nuclease family protein [uncultured Aquitalea sp.]|nr:GIY-YIG nuclease family protein [uncultured Aquitalea sp.]